MTLWTRFKAFFAPPVFANDAEKTRIAGLLNIILLALIVIGLLAAAITLAVRGATVGVLATVVIAAFASLPLWFMMRRGHVQLVSLILNILIFGMAVSSGYFAGTLRAPIISIFVLSVVLSGLLLGVRGLMVFTGLVLTALLLLLLGEMGGLLPLPLAQPVGVAQWVTYAAIFLTVAILLGLAVRGLNHALLQMRQYAQDLEARQQQLDTLVSERTAELARRVSYLGATSAISQEAASIQEDPQRLLEKAASVIAASFGFYHVGIFLLDEAEEWAVLQAASSEGGQRMLARGYRMKVGAQGMVGYVAAQGRARISSEVGTDAIFFDNPDLPETRAEASLPLRAHNTVIGVLDVQSKSPQAFDEEGLLVLQALADQVAVAVSNARLFQRLEARVESERRNLADLSRVTWKEVLQQDFALSYVSSGDAVEARELWRPEMQAALDLGTPAYGDEDTAPTLALPLRVRGEVIGVIDGRKSAEAGAWTPEEVTLMETLVEQLATAVESARLYEESQRRAARERLIAEVSDRLRASRDVDMVLQATVRELGRALNAVGTIRMTPLPGTEPLESDSRV